MNLQSTLRHEKTETETEDEDEDEDEGCRRTLTADYLLTNY